MEIVSEPDMRLEQFFKLVKVRKLNLPRSPEQAGEYLRTLQAILRSVGSSDGNMEQVK